MKISKKNLAAQLYTIRDYTKTPKDIAESMKNIKAIGYDAVQISGLGPIDPKELAAILDGEGLVCCASHDGGEDQFTKTDALIRKAFREEIPNTTKIIIAQRVSSIEDADQIIVLENGAISGIGTSEELLKTNAIYREVYVSQVKGGEDHE